MLNKLLQLIFLIWVVGIHTAVAMNNYEMASERIQSLPNFNHSHVIEVLHDASTTMLFEVSCTLMNLEDYSIEHRKCILNLAREINGFVQLHARAKKDPFFAEARAEVVNILCVSKACRSEKDYLEFLKSLDLRGLVSSMNKILEILCAEAIEETQQRTVVSARKSCMKKMLSVVLFSMTGFLLNGNGLFARVTSENMKQILLAGDLSQVENIYD
ncbi:hypothetical protein FJ364_02885 [Candidatus Dependentiae bacterium]|nr:hypothetical protein [Candidatus Dependentiae bacterium]